MRIAVMGSGGVGGYFGARLAEGGHDVGFVARGRHLEALRSNGLRVLSPAAMTSSMHHDLEHENRLEVAWLSGDVVARGAETGVPTPANRAVADMLAVHADGRRG